MHLDQLFEMFLNEGAARRTPAKEAPKPTVTIGELVRRGSSVIRFDGKLYRITAAEVEITKKV